MSESTLLATLGFYTLADLVLIGVAVGAGYFLAWYARRQLGEFPRQPGPWWRHFLLGAGWGLLATLLIILPAWAAGGFSPGPDYAAFDYGAGRVEPSSVVFLWTLFGPQALMEELLFRGIALPLVTILLFFLALIIQPKRLRLNPADLGDSKKGVWRIRAWTWSGLAANLSLAVVFGIGHASNPNAEFLPLLNIALASLVLGQLFLFQGSIFGCWSLHWVWNASIATLGLPVSGIAVTPPPAGLGFTGARAGLLSGGAFGPEGSILWTIGLTALFLYLALRTVGLTNYQPATAQDSPEVSPDDESIPADCL